MASIVRIYYLNGLFKNTDATWWMGPSFAWSSIEPSVAIISACLPTLAPLFRMGRKKGTSSSPYYVSDRTGQSGTGNHLRSHSRSRNVAGRFNAGQHSRIEDDEVELTYKVQGGDASSQRSPDSQGSSEYERHITVKTQVSVTSQGRRDASGRDHNRQI